MATKKKAKKKVAKPAVRRKPAFKKKVAKKKPSSKRKVVKAKPKRKPVARKKAAPKKVVKKKAAKKAVKKAAKKVVKKTVKKTAKKIAKKKPGAVKPKGAKKKKIISPAPIHTAPVVVEEIKEIFVTPEGELEVTETIVTVDTDNTDYSDSIEEGLTETEGNPDEEDGTMI